MANPLLNSGFFGTASLKAAPANFLITGWKVKPVAKAVEYETSGTGMETVRIFTFRDVTVEIDYAYDFANDPYSLTDTAIINPAQGSSPKLFVGCILENVNLYANCTVKGTPAGGVLWNFTSLGVMEMPMGLAVAGKVTGSMMCKGFGVNGSSSSINAWGVQTMTPP